MDDSGKLLGQAVEQALFIRGQDTFDDKIMDESFPALMLLCSRLVNLHKDKMQVLGKTEHAQGLDEWLHRLNTLSERAER